MPTKIFAQESLNPITDHCSPYLRADCDAESMDFPSISSVNDYKVRGVDLFPAARKAEKLRASGKAGALWEPFRTLRQLSAPFYQRGCFGGIVTDSLFRPFALRRLRTLRPPGVAIRARKPWVLFRLILLG